MLAPAVPRARASTPRGSHQLPLLVRRSIPALVRRSIPVLITLVLIAASFLWPSSTAASELSGPRHVAIIDSEVGRWLIRDDGSSTALGSSPMLASGIHQTVAAAAHPNRFGHWTVDAAGSVVATGDAGFYGDLRDMGISHPIVGIASTPSGQGYWLVGEDGGVFAFGDATFRGSTGAIALNQPIVGIAATGSGGGYWLVARDGGIFAFGDAPFHGSTGSLTLREPIVGMAATPSGAGYRLVARDGGVFAFGDARFHGSLGNHWTIDVTGVVTTSTGYAIIDAGGRIAEFGSSSSGEHPDNWTAPTDSEEAAVAAELHRRMNAERLARGLQPLLWDTKLQATAREWSVAMSIGGFQHSNVNATIAEVGGLDRLAENIYRGSVIYADAGSAHNGFMASPEHRHTLLASAYTTAGIGVFCDDSGQLWVTVHFAAPDGHAPGGSRSATSPLPVAAPDQDGASC